MWKKYTGKKWTAGKQPNLLPTKQQKNLQNQTNSSKTILNYLTLQVESTEYQNEELLIPTLTTVVGRFSF